MGPVRTPLSRVASTAVFFVHTKRILLAEGDGRADAYRPFVAASHLDSLATQRGTDEETRKIADFLAEYIAETLADCRDAWK